MASKFNTDWSFLSDLRGRGRAAAQDWLSANLAQIGIASTVDLQRPFR